MAALPTDLNDEVAKVWSERPDVLRAFIDVRSNYEQLCNEVEYILRKRIEQNGIEYSAIVSRAKTLRSFCEKLSRKQYDDPLHDITDIAGVRIVFLYKSDRRLIEKIIESEFRIKEKVDKIEEQNADQFGYGALHYLVRLGRKASGARYDDLKKLLCEIQVRTIGQDAWAIIDHHLSYKQESDVPKVLRRKLNSLSGFFETADDQFDRIRSEREQYRDSVKIKLKSQTKALDQELNLDTLLEYLRWRFPNVQATDTDRRLSLALARALEYGYESLTKIDALLTRTEEARKAMAKKKPVPAAAGELIRAIALEQPAYRNTPGWDDELRTLFTKHEHLLIK